MKLYNPESWDLNLGLSNFRTLSLADCHLAPTILAILGFIFLSFI